VGLEGRLPTVFRTPTGRLVNNIDVTWALLPLALPQFTLHQEADGSLLLRVRGEVPHAAVRQAILDLFGADQPLTIAPLTDAETRGGKVIQYTSALDLPYPPG
jgi:phenylacetate-CoA ligase